MADVQSNIHVNIDTSGALASLKLLQRQISAFHTQMSKSGASASAVAANQAQNLMNSINATGKFQASMRTVTSSTEHFTNALEKNKLSSREYFRYTGAATKSFGRLFKSEFDTINKVARERVKDIQTQYIKMGRGANGALQAIAVRPLTLDMKNLGTQTAMAAQKQQLLNQLLKQGSTNLLNFGKNTQWAGRQLMVGFTLPLVMLGATASKTFMKLEEQAIRFKRVYGELFTTAEETDEMVKDIRLLANEYTKYGVAVEDTMRMAADAAAMGKMNADLLAQVAQATRLAVLGSVEQEEALKTTISITNAFGVATEDLAKKIDFLNAVENQTVVSIEDLTMAIPKAGPVVKQLGGDVEDLAFFLTAMKEGGINASEGANALKSGLASLINPAEKSAKFLQNLGININGIVEANAGDVKSTVIDFAKALDTLDPLNRARAIEQLFGKFQFSRLSTLFQNVVGEGTQAARVLELTSATTEELAILSERELGKIENTTTYKFKKVMEDLKVTIAPVGEQFLKALTPIVEFVSKILEKFSNLGDGSKNFLTVMTVVLGAIGPIALMTFGLLANGVANIIKLFANMKIGFNRAGSSTQILGQQTSYLTQEQLEAAAVAASLEQVHTRLRQVFTAESSAVNNLAAAYRNAIAAQVGFTGPVRGGPVRGTGVSQAQIKYSTGTTRVPGTGKKDTVPSMLTPGEAVIPAGVAQDPRFKPIISAMVNKRLQGFNLGTTEVTGSQATKTKPDTVFAHANGNTKVDLSSVPDEFKAKAQDLRARGFEKGTTYSAVGFDIPEELHKKLTRNQASLTEYAEEIKKTRSVQTMTSKLMGPPSNMTATQAAKTADQIRTNLVKSLEAMPKTVLPDGTIKDTLIGDRHIYSRMGNIKSGILGGLARDPRHASAISALLSPQGLTSFQKPKMVYNSTATPEELFKAVAASDSAKNTKASAKRLFDYHPNEVVKVSRDAKGNIIAYERPEVSARTNELKKTTNNAVLVGNKFKGGRSDGSSGTIKVASVKGKRSQAALAALRGLEERRASGQQVTRYRSQISEGTGYSNVAAKHLSGIHETEDGRKVYVKPMVDEKSARAEMRATRIAREVHGLATPKQELRMIQDPLTGKTMYALESAFDPRFDPDKMPKKFSKKEYFKQMVAAGLRGDKDLKRGNLGGNVLTDVGTAGVFATASGARDYATKMPSLEEMARTNLSGVKGSAAARSPFWFGNATADIPKSMTADQYERMMVKEIDRSIKNLEKVIPKLGLTDPEKPLYTSMLERLKEGKNVDWKKIHTLHSSIVVKPDEMLQDEKTGKLTKPKTTSKPANVRSDSGSPKDTRVTQEPKGKKIVQRPKRVGRFVMPGKADAPIAAGTVSMPGSARKLSELTSAYVKGAIADAAKAKIAGQKIAGAIIDSAAKEGTQATKRKRRLATKEQGPAPIGAVAPAGATILPIVSKPASVTPAEPSGRVRQYLQKRETRKAEKVAAGKGPKMGMTGGVMAASGVAMMASMAPGQVGELAQKIMMPLMGIAMIMPMLQNKFTALAVGVGLVVAAYAYQKMAFDKAQDAALKLAEAMGSGTEAIKGLSTFAGKVSAGEIMQRRRKDSFSPFQIQTGKTTFGQAFVESEQGKEMTKNVGQNIRSSGKVVAQGQVVNQLATAVAAGALDAAQARSIVANLAQELGDYSFGIEVNGKLNELLGPNGENILKDPIGVRVKLLQNTREKMNLSTDAVSKAGRLSNKEVGKSVGFTTAGAGGGAVVGAIAGGLLGAVTGMLAGPAGAAVGATLGVKIGAAAGASLGAIAGNLFGRKDMQKRLGEASGASVAMQKIALQQQQEMMDSVELEYQNKLAIAKASGDQVEADILTNKYIEDRNTLLTENGILVADIQNNFASADSSTQKALMAGVDKAITKQYKGTAIEDVAPLAQQQLNDSGISQELKYTLKMEMASGQIDPMQMIEIFDTFGKDKESMEAVATIVTKFGGAFANQAMGVVGMFKDPKQATDFVARISTKTAPEAQKELELFRRISQINSAIPNVSVALDYYNQNPEAASALQKTIDDINDKKGKISLQVATEILGAGEMAVLKEHQEYFNSLPEDQQKVYLQTLTTLVNMEGNNEDDIELWKSKNPGKTNIDYYKAMTFAVTKVSIDNTSKPVTPGSTPGADKKIDSSPLDDLVKRLRDVRMNQIKVTEGFAASSKALNKLFGGNKTISVFSGIENDMRKLGAGEDLIDLITGMDPKEYEAQKRKLFKFDSKDNIIGIKDTARSIGDALQSVKLGEFVSEQERMSKQIGNQTAALKRLQAAGVEGSVALEAVADATFAAAIANKKLSDKELKKIVKAANQATAAQKRFAASSGLVSEQAALKERADLLQRLTKNASKFTNDQLEAIMDSPALQNALISLDINNPEFKKTIDEAIENANVELKIKKITISGMQEIFDEGFGNAMEAIDVEQTTYQLKFDADTKGFKDIIDNAQDEIALAQFDIDDREAALKQIEDQEEKINEKYDKRVEALNNVAKANASISQQQKGQLTLAEALTSGDIAAAAKAAQDMRAQQAADAVTKQQEALEKSREFEISRTRTKDGKSRKQLEKEIKDLQDKIFDIEETRVEPAQEAIRKLEVTLREAIKPLDDQRRMWELIKNGVDLARVATEKFQNAIREALNIAKNLSAAYASKKSDNSVVSADVASVAGVVIPDKTDDTVSDDSVVNATTTEEVGISESTEAKIVTKTMEEIIAGITPSALAAAESGSIGAASIEAQIVTAAIAEKAANAAKITPSALAAKESGAIGAASITAQLRAIAAEANKAESYAKFDPGRIGFKSKGGMMKPLYRPMGGIIPYFLNGGFAKGTDTVPAMLTPGEFVMSKYAVDSFGVDNMKKINNGDSIGGTVYNNTYTLTVNAKTGANPNEIAQAVMSTIKKVDDRRIRGVSLNG